MFRHHGSQGLLERVPGRPGEVRDYFTRTLVFIINQLLLFFISFSILKLLPLIFSALALSVKSTILWASTDSELFVQYNRTCSTIKYMVLENTSVNEMERIMKS